jgi:putative ABC transport system permease protein
MDKNLAIYDTKTLDQYLGAAVAHPRFSALLLTIFATVALALAAVGLYGVMSHCALQRRREIGIRSALGAQPREVLRLMMIQGLKPALLGLAIGLGAALALTRLIAGLLFSVSATDPLTFAVTSAIVLIVALGACFVPARRATRIDPVTALRSE